jgi:hypothetical protein
VMRIVRFDSLRGLNSREGMTLDALAFFL